MTAPTISVQPPSKTDDEEYAAVVKQAAHDGVQEVTREEWAAIKAKDHANFVEWDKKLWDRNPYSIGYNHYMSDNSKQWGAMPGVNSGNGLFESQMPMHLFLALGAKYQDKDWWKDDAKFYKFLREHPELDGRPGKNMSRGEKFLKPGQKLIL